MEVQKVIKDYAIVDGEKIYFDEPFEETPDRADFEQWLHRIEGLLEMLFARKVDGGGYDGGYSWAEFHLPNGEW